VALEERKRLTSSPVWVDKSSIVEEVAARHKYTVPTSVAPQPARRSSLSLGRRTEGPPRPRAPQDQQSRYLDIAIWREQAKGEHVYWRRAIWCAQCASGMVGRVSTVAVVT
jgi:hypothetical protein